MQGLENANILSKLSACLAVATIVWFLPNLWQDDPDVGEPIELSTAITSPDRMPILADRQSFSTGLAQSTDTVPEVSESSSGEPMLQRTWHGESDDKFHSIELADSYNLSKDSSALLAQYYETASNDEKTQILQHLWSLSPGIFDNDEIHELLALAAYDENDQIRALVTKMQADYQHLAGGESNPLKRLALQADQLALMKAKYEDRGPVPQQAVDRDMDESEYQLRRISLVEELSQFIMFSQDPEVRFSALNILSAQDNSKTLELLSYLLSQSRDQEERMAYIEVLKSGIGRFDSNALNQLFQRLQYDYNESIASIAKLSIEHLHDYDSEV